MFAVLFKKPKPTGAIMIVKEDGKYKTRNGREVRIYAVLEEQNEVHGAWNTGNEWKATEWTMEGEFDAKQGKTILDLIEAK